MRIGIDAHILGKQKGGVEHTVEILVRALAETDRENRYFVYVTATHPFRPGELPDNFTLRLLPAASPWIGRLILVPYYYWSDRLDVIHLQRATPLFGCANTVLHVHDAMYATHPHLFPAWRRAILNPIFRWSGKRATQVVTPTLSSRSDIIEAYKIDPCKIHLVPDSADTRELYLEPDLTKIRQAAERFHLRLPYVIFLGAIERNKNVHGLLHAFSRFLKVHPEYSLALVGKWRSETRGGYTEEIRGNIRRLGLQERVVMTGWVSKEDRRLLLNGASMLVFPSEAEGLGLPPLEAMACGVPVISSDLPSIREYYGDSLLTCRLHDLENLAELMSRLASDRDLAQTLVQRGFQKVSRHRWDWKGPKMLEIYRLAAGTG